MVVTIDGNGGVRTVALTVFREYGVWQGEVIPVTPERSKLRCIVSLRDDLSLVEMQVAEGQGVIPHSMWVRYCDLPPVLLVEIKEAAQTDNFIDLELALRVEGGLVYFDAIWTGSKESAVRFFANKEVARTA